MQTINLILGAHNANAAAAVMRLSGYQTELKEGPKGVFTLYYWKSEDEKGTDPSPV